MNRFFPSLAPKRCELANYRNPGQRTLKESILAFKPGLIFNRQRLEKNANDMNTEYDESKASEMIKQTWKTRKRGILPSLLYNHCFNVAFLNLNVKTLVETYRHRVWNIGKNRYKIIGKKLGSGSEGEGYKIKNVRTNEISAMKFMVCYEDISKRIISAIKVCSNHT